MHFLRLKYALLLALPVLISCQRSEPATVKQGAATPAVDAAPVIPGDTVPADRVVDDTARFLSGLPGKSGSGFSDLEASAAWQEHRKLMDAAWANADTKLVHGLHEFQKSELSDSSIDHHVLFYPFSGPDALTATVLFPHSPIFFLVALEPAGTVPSSKLLEKKELAKYLAEVRTTMASELGKSFFVTREMDRQFRGQITDGLVVPTLFLLARTEHTVLGLKYVRLDEEGKVVERKKDVPVEGTHPNKGFELEFRTDADQSVHRLYYFSLNLDDKHLAGNKGFLTYVNAIPTPTTMLKATSYMTHQEGFTMIRDLVMKDSGVIFQDDTGIPFKYFTPETWNVQLYGEYTRPYQPFGYMEQADLRKAFLKGGVKPLTLRLGYGFGKVTSNLLLAKRIK